jgi:hypothetical protein
MAPSSVALDQWTADARALGIEHATNAASWTYDGNSDIAERTRVLGMLRDGDPAVWDYLPAQPNLSGEWADAPTPRSLFEEITGLDAHAEATYNVEAYALVSGALCNAYEDGVSESFGPACEAALVELCGAS